MRESASVAQLTQFRAEVEDARSMLSDAVNASIDPRRYPRLAAYVDALPDGLDSYPECRAKGTLILSSLEGHDTDALGEGLPEAVVDVLRTPPLVGMWCPAPMSDAIFYTIVDAYYRDDAAAMEWTRERTRRTADSKLYRMLGRVAGPGMLLRMTSEVHGLFQRGTDLKVEERRRNYARLRMTHPPYLHGGLNHLVNVAMFEVLLVNAGAKHVDARMLESEPSHAVYEATWGKSEEAAPAVGGEDVS